MSDPNTRTKNRQLAILSIGMGGILLIAIGGMFLFDDQPGGNRDRATRVSITAPGNLEDRDAWRAHQAAQEKSNELQIQEVRELLKIQSAENRLLTEQIKELKASARKVDSQAVGAVASAKIVPEPVPAAAPEPLKSLPVPVPATPATSSLLDKPLPLGNGLGGRQILEPPTKYRGSSLNQPLEPVALPRREVEIFTFGSGAASSGASSAKPEARAEHKAEASSSIEFLPAGSFVRVAMLNGVDAPTGGQAQSNPLPVAFHVLDTANLANKHRLDIRDCRIIASTWGELSSERMMGRTETLACIINGETVEMAIKGQVIGEDGKAGVRGRLVTKQGQLIANALFAGALSGIGQAVQGSSYTTSAGAGGVTQIIDPSKVSRAAIGGGLGSAAQQLAQYYLKAADKLFPVIETDGGRTVEILITKGATYSGKALARNDYRGLLKRSGTHTRRYQDD